jgi:disulfide bond formation protein DsbB
MTQASPSPRAFAAPLVEVASAKPWLSAGLFIAVAAAGTILGAYFFQYVLGLAPCPLCLEQRTPYYLAIPLALAVTAAAAFKAPALLIRLGLLVLAGVLVWGAYLGVYHAGAEWGFWAGPTTCAQPTTIARTPGDLLRQIQTGPRIADCTVAAWRFLGVSLAGWNALIAAVLALVALAAASRPRELA